MRDFVEVRSRLREAFHIQVPVNGATVLPRTSFHFHDQYLVRSTTSWYLDLCCSCQMQKKLEGLKRVLASLCDLCLPNFWRLPRVGGACT